AFASHALAHGSFQEEETNMRRTLLSTFGALITLAALSALFALAALSATTTTADAATRWVCPPCAQPCDTISFAGPGTCPACGMALVDASTLPQPPPTKKIGILIFDGVEIIDYTGPWEVFGATGYNVYTVADKKTPVTTAMGMTVVPGYTFADA